MSAEKQKDPISQALRAEKENIITLGTRLFQCPEPGFRSRIREDSCFFFVAGKYQSRKKNCLYPGLKASIGKEGWIPYCTGS